MFGFGFACNVCGENGSDTAQDIANWITCRYCGCTVCEHCKDINIQTICSDCASYVKDILLNEDKGVRL